MAWTWWDMYHMLGYIYIYLYLYLYICIYPMIFLSYHHGFRGTPPQLCRLGSSLSSSWAWRCCCPCWVSPRRSHRSRACSRRGARLCSPFWAIDMSLWVSLERFWPFFDFYGRVSVFFLRLLGDLFRFISEILGGFLGEARSSGWRHLIRLSFADHLGDFQRSGCFSGPGW